MSEIAVYAGQALARYGFPGGHPFSTKRFGAFWTEFQQRELIKLCAVKEPVELNPSLMQKFHTAAYIEKVRKYSIEGSGYLDVGDTPAFKGVFEAAMCVCATVNQAVSDIMSGSISKAFVPIGGLHHARRDTAGGFCVFNDAGIAIERLLNEYKLNTVAYVDIDAHHGDGVFYSFESEPRLVFADLHQEHIYPGTGDSREQGRGEAAGKKINFPMPYGANDHLFLQKWSLVKEFVSAQKPEFIILQCGADSIAGDPLTGLEYSPAVFRQASADLAQIADTYASGRLLALGGGGYNLRNLAAGWNNVIAGFFT